MHIGHCIVLPCAGPNLRGEFSPNFGDSPTEMLSRGTNQNVIKSLGPLADSTGPRKSMELLIPVAVPPVVHCGHHPSGYNLCYHLSEMHQIVK